MWEIYYFITSAENHHFHLNLCKLHKIFLYRYKDFMYSILKNTLVTQCSEVARNVESMTSHTVFMTTMITNIQF
jgi:hypothetical protein